jgi:hypothetical protein
VREGANTGILMHMSLSRRDWVLGSLCWSELLAAQPLLRAARFVILSSTEVAEVRALANTILPETDTPGAEQAGAADFIEAALAGYDRDQRELYHHGLADVGARTRRMFPPSRAFADLSSSQQTALLKTIEKTEFFEKLRTHTILAYFGNPEFGWKLLGRDPAMHFEPPFGFYDAEEKAK